MTDAQIALELSPLVQPDFAPHMTLSERFDLWVSNNEHVVTLAADFTRQWLATGKQRASINAIWERMRWEAGIRAPEGKFALNNDFRAPMSRLLMNRYDDLAGCFATRATPALDRSAA